MLFNSISFLWFFPIVTAAYFLLPHRWRWALLLAASCWFYMTFIPVYILILAFTIVVDYYAGILIENARGPTRKRYLLASVFANVGVLFVFKYFNFFNANLAALARALDWNYSLSGLGLILPIGLSFHTFQAMSYTMEVYYGRCKAERHFGVYALYVMYYPQLVAGPIERPQNLLPQFHAEHCFDYDRVARGLQLMLWGMVKKVVVADRLAVLVDQVYNHPGAYGGGTVLLATYFFAFQIYCDFSGYSDIALGSSQVMGITLMQNFKRPYFAQSIPEFWRRWHVSLSTWFRDYLYIPLGGSRASAARRYANAFIVFIVSGLWHGANWTYLVWGAVHGAYMILSLAARGAREQLAGALGLTRFPSLVRAFNIILTFHLACFAWIFFRANTLADAWTLIGRLVPPWESLDGPSLWGSLLHLGLAPWDLRIAFGAVAGLLVLDMFQEAGPLRQRLAARPAWLRWSLSYAALFAILFLGKFTLKQFIYFQF